MPAAPAPMTATLREWSGEIGVGRLDWMVGGGLTMIDSNEIGIWGLFSSGSHHNFTVHTCLRLLTIIQC